MRLHAARDGRHAVAALGFGPLGEVFDPATGQVILSLDSGTYHRDQSRASVAFLERGHYPGVFCGALHVSPDGARTVQDGWVRGPAGVVGIWDLDLRFEPGGNPFEPADGPTFARVRESNDWNSAMVWLDEHRIALDRLEEYYDPPRSGVRILGIRKVSGAPTRSRRCSAPKPRNRNGRLESP